MTDVSGRKVQHKKTIADLLDVMTSLRTPETGCPWDLQQTFSSIAPYTIEEAYEVADAIERADVVDLNEELGDLLLQVVYHAQIAREIDAFDFEDVVDGITRKMIRRHPHVFGNSAEREAGAKPGFWERIKDQERHEKARAKSSVPNHNIVETEGLKQTDTMTKESVLDDVPLNLPALVRAIKLQDKAARVGFDWPSLAPVMDKMREELSELDEALASGQASKIENEFGDLLFVVANVARHLKIDAEKCLRGTNAKFVRRFGRVEELLLERGLSPSQSNLDEMDALWDQAKAEERSTEDKPSSGRQVQQE